MGTAELVSGETNIACLDPETVNIVANGHQPIFASIIMEKAGDAHFQSEAKKAGAKGIKLYGSLCEGQQLMNVSGREEYTKIFGGQLGNWIQEELFIATGLVDLFMMDLNCSVPTLKTFADKYGTKLLSTDPVVSFPGVDKLQFDPEKAAAAVQEGVAAYRALIRKGVGEELHATLLYQETERWHDLTDLIERRLGFAFTVEEAVRLRYRLGEICETHLHDPERAVENYAAALGGEPGHIGATAALERSLDLDPFDDILVVERQFPLPARFSAKYVDLLVVSERCKPTGI